MVEAEEIEQENQKKVPEKGIQVKVAQMGETTVEVTLEKDATVRDALDVFLKDRTDLDIDDLDEYEFWIQPVGKEIYKAELDNKATDGDMILLVPPVEGGQYSE